MVRYVDLSLTIESADQWHEFPRSLVLPGSSKNRAVKVGLGELSSLDDSSVMASTIDFSTQSFTHLDVPRHILADGDAVDEIPIDRFTGEATVFDASHVGPGEAVTVDDLEACNVDLQEGDIALIRTDWTDEAWGTKRFWTEMIHLEADVADWLLDHGVKGLGQDFYTDIQPIRLAEDGSWHPKEGSPCHHALLPNGVILFEWLTNLGDIREDRVEFFGLPLKIGGADGSPMRAIAVER